MSGWHFSYSVWPMFADQLSSVAAGADLQATVTVGDGNRSNYDADCCSEQNYFHRMSPYF
jgi:hypothetical protein